MRRAFALPDPALLAETTAHVAGALGVLRGVAAAESVARHALALANQAALVDGAVIADDRVEPRPGQAIALAAQNLAVVLLRQLPEPASSADHAPLRAADDDDEHDADDRRGRSTHHTDREPRIVEAEALLRRCLALRSRLLGRGACLVVQPRWTCAVVDIESPRQITRRPWRPCYS